MNIALIEFNPYHDECLFSQVAFIKHNTANKVFLIYNHNLGNRINFWDMLNGSLPISSKPWGIGYIRILLFLRNHNVDYVIFNSVHSPQVRRLLRLSNKKRKIFGIVHDLKEFNSKNSKTLSARINGYFLLNDYLVEKASQKQLASTHLTSFYPIFFSEITPVELSKSEGEVWVAIPGLMEPWRRDYERLLHSFSKNHLNDNVKVIFLGKSTDKYGGISTLRKSFEELDKHDQFVFFDDYIENNLFHSYLIKSDYLLPLIHQSSEAGNRYLDKITGLYNLGFSYRKRFIMERFLEEFEDFKTSAVFYEASDDIVEVINSLPATSEVHAYSNPKFELEYQAEKYNDFLLGTSS